MRSRSRLVIAFAVASISFGLGITAAAAQTAGQEQPPPVAPERPFSFPSHTTAKLDNGLIVFVIEDRRQPVVSATLMLPSAGASQHPGSQAGLAAMTAALLRQGTATRSAQEIAEAIDSVGGVLSAGAGADTTQASVTVVTPALDTGFELLADIVQRPAFADEEVERWRRQTLSSLQVAYSDPEYLRDVVGQRLAFGEHPYAYPPDGFPDTVRALSAGDVRAFHKARYTPAGTYLAIAGDITPQAAVAAAKKHFGGWTGAAPPPAKAPEPERKRRVVVIDKADAVQTQFGMVGTGLRRSDPDWLPFTVANQIFGGAFNSRLNMRLRAQEGLTYGARSGLDSRRLAGAWELTSFTRTEETGRAIDLMLEVLRDFRKNPVTPPELGEATSYLSGVFAIETETASAVASRVLTSALHGLPADYWQTYRDRVRKITAADVTGAVERHVNPEQLSIVAVGNAAGFARALEPLGDVSTIPVARLDLTQPDLTAETEAAAGPDAPARAMALITAAAEAVGGAEALSAVKDMTSTANVTLVTPGGELQGTATAQILHPDKVKLLMTLPVGELEQVYDGAQAWTRMGPQPAVDLPPGMNTEMQRAILMSGGIGVLREALAGRAQVAALESRTEDGVTLARVSWKRGEIEMILGFDPETHRLARIDFRGMSPQGMADSEVRLEDYKDAGNGLMMPTRTVTYRDGQKAVEIVVTAWKLNTGVAAEEFVKK